MSRKKCSKHIRLKFDVVKKNIYLKITLVNSGFVALDIKIISSNFMPTIYETMKDFAILALVFFFNLHFHITL